ncbi:MAG: hypothetical protein K2J77_07605 [Oscillospiraceae bacterium]|nr:hypothetical protein [Oscillospiraceae bacterium]
MRHSTKIIAILFLTLSICLSGCKSGSAIDEENTPASDLSFSSDDLVQSEAAHENDPTFSSEARNLKTVDFSSEQSALKGYIKFARSEISSGFLNGDECAITLRNVYGNENPEMIIAIRKKRPSVTHEHSFTTDENDEPIYLGEFYGVHDAFYTDGEFVYAIWEDETAMGIEKLHPLEDEAAPDLAEYQNSDALDFVNNTHTYFVRYNNRDWDSEKQCWKNPEELAAMFYYEDSGLYEAYLVSKRVLDLAAFEINDYINDEGNHIPAYPPGENYLVSRREYEQIKSRVFEILTQITDEPVISSGWIDIDDVDKWLDSLA